MCVIINAHTRAPSADTIEAAARNNPDGWGFAYTDGSRVLFQKGLTTARVVKLAEQTPTPWVAHTRLTTVGASSKALCHPFPIERGARVHTAGRASAVLFHNGHVGHWRSLALAAGLQTRHLNSWSDSRVIAHILGTMPEKDQVDFLLECEPSRFLLLPTQGPAIEVGQWHKRDGFSLSSLVCDSSYLSSQNERFWDDWAYVDPTERVSVERKQATPYKRSYRSWLDAEADLAKRKLRGADTDALAREAYERARSEEPVDTKRPPAEHGKPTVRLCGPVDDIRRSRRLI